MYGLRKMLEMEERRLSAIAEEVSCRLQNAPAGALRVTSSKGNVQYMYVAEGSTARGGTYIRKSDLAFAEQLAQKGYDQKVLVLLKKRVNQFRRILADYEDFEIENVYQQELEGRKKLIFPAEEIWEETIQKWMETPYQGKPFRADAPEIYTKKGERVRSKSEKILADTFLDLGIPYKYECPLCLKGGRVVYPDFTFLSRKTGREIYWEHDGRMDDPEYAAKAVKKIESYIKSEIYPGEQLIITYETAEYVLSDAIVKALISRYFI